MVSFLKNGISTTAANVQASFTFGIFDYVVFIIMLGVSSGIGVYFGFFSKSKNTTEEYLMGGKRMKTIPIAISLVASQLSGVSIMSIPAESYSFGFNYMWGVISMIAVIPTICLIIIPVFYENNISNCYEYLQMRFNKRTRQIVTFSFVLNAFLMLPVIIFVPALAFSQVTGANIHLINTIVCSICVFYTMLGGIKAVVWTDVAQAAIMILSVAAVGLVGIHNDGGLRNVLKYAEDGGRLDISYSLDPRKRGTMWNTFIGGFFMWVGHIGLNQSCVQRIVSLPSLGHAKRSLIIAGIGFVIIMGFNFFTGIIMFAHYRDCDPIAAGIADKADTLMSFFVQDIMGHISGMPGLFISCVISAALSTMSAVLNSLAGIVYFDYIRPFIKHTEQRANLIMKTFVVATGIYCMLCGHIVQQFSSILQMVITITGISSGAVVGIFFLGIFVPRTNGKVAVCSVAVSFFAMLWIIVNAQFRLRSGAIKYTPLPTSVDGCETAFNISIIGAVKTNDAFTLISNTTSTRAARTILEENAPFSIYDVSFYWYKVMGALLVWIVAIPLSYLMPTEEDEKLNPKLLSALVRKFLNVRCPTEMDEVPLNVSPPPPPPPPTPLQQTATDTNLKSGKSTQVEYEKLFTNKQ